MPYAPEHKAEVRRKIVRSARRLFNRNGFDAVSIDQVMAGAGLTRGGFYNHFTDKAELFAEAVSEFPMEREEEGMPLPACGPDLALAIIDGYVSFEHQQDIDHLCPLVALSSDVSRAGPKVRQAYAQVFEGMAGMFQHSLEGEGDPDARRRSLAMAVTCVGAMVLARAVDDPAFSEEIRQAARAELTDRLGHARIEEVHAAD